MSEFADQFRNHFVDSHSAAERLIHQNVKEEARKLAERIVADRRKNQLQLLVAHKMREDAKSIVGEIPDSIEPTTLIVTESSSEPVDLTGMNRKQRRENANRTRIVFTPINRLSAWLVDGRFKSAWDYDTEGGGFPRSLYFEPIFLTDTGELWTVPNHTIRIGYHTGDEQKVSLQDSIAKHRANYRSSLRGIELPSMTTITNVNSSRYESFYDVELPRLTSDNDLIDLKNIDVSQLEGEPSEVLSQWRQSLLEIVE